MGATFFGGFPACGSRSQHSHSLTTYTTLHTTARLPVCSHRRVSKLSIGASGSTTERALRRSLGNRVWGNEATGLGSSLELLKPPPHFILILPSLANFISHLHPVHSKFTASVQASYSHAMVAYNQLKTRTRADYPYVLEYRTRW